MSTIVTRAAKGSQLEWAEVDANFTNLNTDKYQSGDAATFTTLTATGQTSLGGAAGSESLRAVPVASAANWVEISGASLAGATPSISATGASTSISFRYQTKGSGVHRFDTNGSVRQFQITDTASAVNYVQVTGAATTGLPQISAQGSDTNPGLLYITKGIGEHRFASNASAANIQFRVLHTAGTIVNYAAATGAAAGAAPAFSVAGTDTNIDLALTPKGTGLVRFGTYTSLASTTFTIDGYVEIKDSAGNVRKLAVIV